MKTRSQRVDKLLILSPHAARMNEDVEAKLRTAFEDHLIIDFDPKHDFEKLITPTARVIVAGGDGTIEFVVRKLADTDHPLGILPMGTYNNLAHALGLDDDLDQAIAAALHGQPRPITLGRVNGHVLVEACAIGLFGDAIVLGESAKDLKFGELPEKVKDFVQAKPFHYQLTGDLEGEGTAMSLVFSNTASIGIQLPVSTATPVDRYLEFPPIRERRGRTSWSDWSRLRSCRGMRRRRLSAACFASGRYASRPVAGPVSTRTTSSSAGRRQRSQRRPAH